jgi:hypothetical protein
MAVVLGARGTVFTLKDFVIRLHIKCLTLCCHIKVSLSYIVPEGIRIFFFHFPSGVCWSFNQPFDFF